MFVRHVGGSKSCALPYYYAEDGQPDCLRRALGHERTDGERVSHQEGELLLRLDTLCNGVERKPVSDRENRAADCLGIAARV